VIPSNLKEETRSMGQSSTVKMSVYSSTLYQPAYEHLETYYRIFEKLILYTNKRKSNLHTVFFDADDEILNLKYFHATHISGDMDFT